MLHKLITVLLILFGSIVSVFGFGQNYQLISSNRTAFFTDSSNDLFSLKVDSAKFVEEDSIFYLMKILQNDSVFYNCKRQSGSWFASKVIQKPNGDTYIFNKKENSCLIKSRSNLLDQWICGTFGDDTIVYALTESLDTINFFGVQDSIKTIGFICFDGEMNSIDLPINSKKIVISKNFGILTAINFWDFPGFLPVSTYNKTISTYNNIGISNPELGFQNLTWYDIFMRNPGDVIHWEISNVSYENPYHTTNSKIIDQYISSVYSDSVITTYIYRQNYYCSYLGSSSNPSNLSISFSRDTILEIKNYNYVLDYLPNQNFTNLNNNTIYTMNMSNTTIREKYWETWYSVYLLASEDGLYCPPNAGCNSTSYRYYAGFGGPFGGSFQCDPESGTTLSSNLSILRYYKTDNEEWGTPFNFLGLEETKNSIEAFVYPNPVEDFLKVYIPSYFNICQIQIFDSSGHIVYEGFINSETSDIYVNHFCPGLYQVRLILDGNAYRVLRVIKI